MSDEGREIQHLSSELGLRNEIDVVAGEAYVTGVLYERPELISDSVSLTSKIVSTPFYHDRFGAVEAEARDLRREVDDILAERRKWIDPEEQKVKDGWIYSLLRDEAGVYRIEMKTETVAPEGSFSTPSRLERRDKIIEAIAGGRKVTKTLVERREYDDLHEDWQWYYHLEGQFIGSEVKHVHHDGKKEFDAAIFVIRDELLARKIWGEISAGLDSFTPRELKKYDPKMYK